MPVNPLPPQAFTKETLQKAYTWLLTQSPSIKEMASTQDMLVSLYLKAQRNGDASLEAPSIQNFKQELKSLAGIMGDLQTQAPPPPSAVAKSTQLPPVTHHAQTQGFSSSTQTVATSMVTTTTNTGFALNQLDETSLQALSDVMQTMNLSSETEALRALVALGYRQFKKINN